MAWKHTSLVGILVGAVVGVALSAWLRPALAGPLIGVLVGAKVCLPGTFRAGARQGGLTGLAMGLLCCLHPLLNEAALRQSVDAWSTVLLSGTVFYSALGALGGCGYVWAARFFSRSSGIFF